MMGKPGFNKGKNDLPDSIQSAQRVCVMLIRNLNVENRIVVGIFAIGTQSGQGSNLTWPGMAYATLPSFTSPVTSFTSVIHYNAHALKLRI